jgi:hypothetical protein
MLARFQLEICTECYRAVHWWNRRTRLGPTQDWLHLACWRRRLRSVEYSSYLQRMEADDQEPALADHTDKTLLHALQGLQELRKLHAIASALHQRMELLERVCDHLRHSYDALESDTNGGTNIIPTQRVVQMTNGSK